MAIPKLPVFYDMLYTLKDGSLTPQAKLYNDSTFQSLNALVTLTNNYISDDGITFPNKTTAQIVALEPSVGLGTVWFNTTLGKLQVKTAGGVIQTITSA